MRAYRKTTRHPVCLYFTDQEALRLVQELTTAYPVEDWSDMPMMTRLLNALETTRKGGHRG
jgi:hypothetical protein